MMTLYKYVFITLKNPCGLDYNQIGLKSKFEVKVSLAICHEAIGKAHSHSLLFYLWHPIHFEAQGEQRICL